MYEVILLIGIVAIYYCVDIIVQSWKKNYDEEEQR